MLNEALKDRVRHLEDQVGLPESGLIYLRKEPIGDRLDKLETFMYDMKSWMRRVEAHLGVEEIERSDGHKQFLGKAKEPLKGYLDED